MKDGCNACTKLPRLKSFLISAVITCVCVGVYFLWEFYPLLLRDHRISHGDGFLHVRCNRVPNVSKASVKLLMSFFSEDQSPPDYWASIAKYTMQNHLAFTNRTGVPYIRATRGHARCGKLRRVLEQLMMLPESSWMFFVDADAGMTCNLPIVTLSEYVSRWHAAVFRYESLDVDMLVMTKFGVFAVRNSKWSRDYLRRLANAVESRRWLCRLTLPENWAFHAVTTQSDFCHIHEVAKVDSELVLKDRYHSVSFLHITGSEAKREPQEFLRALDTESLCLSGQLQRANNFTPMSSMFHWEHWELKEVYDASDFIPRNTTVKIEVLDGSVNGLHVVVMLALVVCVLLGLWHCRLRHQRDGEKIAGRDWLLMALDEDLWCLQGEGFLRKEV